MENVPKIKWWWNIPIILLIGILVPLGVRSFITDDNRYGWGTFSKQVVFNINYYWIMENGDKIRYRPGKELSGRVRNKIKRNGTTRYSSGALISWVNNYTRYVYLQRSRGTEAKPFNAETLYKINSNNFIQIDGKKVNKVIIKYPDKN